MTSNASTRSSLDCLRDSSTPPTLSPRPGSSDNEEQEPNTEMSQKDMEHGGNDVLQKEEDDEEDMDLKARALTKLLKTSSVCQCVILEPHYWKG